MNSLMFTVTTKRSPPKRCSASARPVSVLPIPLEPTSRKTPIGCSGGLRLTFDARIRRAIVAMASS